MILKERQTDQGLLVSVCDAEVLGETFENGEVSLTVKEEFYAGEAADQAGAEVVVETLGRAAVANLVGTRSVEVAVDAGIIDPSQVLEIEGTLHAQYLQF
ncbi:MAG: DUF424 domain-containing protein [Halobacteriales archaeon]